MKSIELNIPQVQYLESSGQITVTRSMNPEPKSFCVESDDGTPEQYPWREVGGIHVEKWECEIGKPGDSLKVKAEGTRRTIVEVVAATPAQIGSNWFWMITLKLK